MIELGNGAIDEASIEWQRAHYSAWVIMSAPLVLGFDPLDTAKLDRLWPIIANREAIAINQNWAGHPGTRVMAWTPPGETRIDGTPLQAFQRSDDVYYTRAAIHTMQLWMKPQPNGSVAILVLNAGKANAAFDLPLAEVAMPPTVRVRDIWAHADVDDAHESLQGHVDGHACKLLLLRPSSSPPPPSPPLPPSPSPPPPPVASVEVPILTTRDVSRESTTLAV